MMIKLADGSQVSVDEFITWNHCKQLNMLTKLGIPRRDETKKKISLKNVGKVISQETRDRMSATMKHKFANGLMPPVHRTYGKDNAASVSVTTPLGKFDSLRAAGIAHNCRADTIKHRTLTGKPGYYCTKNPILVGKQGKPIMTPSGEFASISLAVEYATKNGLKNAINKIRQWLKTHPQQFYYIKDTK